MKHTDKQTMEKIIEDGKTLMTNSVDIVHDRSHTENVETIGLKVYKELKRKGYKGIDDVNEDMVRVAAWWHDCYKAETEGFSLYRLFLEGQESAAIIEKKLARKLTDDDMAMLTDAVRHHAGWSLFPYFFLNRPRSALHKILIEADAYDLITPERARQLIGKDLSLWRKSWVFVDLFIESTMLPLYHRTQTTRKDLFKRLKTYWGLWFWDEWLILKLFFPPPQKS